MSVITATVKNGTINKVLAENVFLLHVDCFAVPTLCIELQDILWEWHRGWRVAQHNAPACCSSHPPWKDCRSPERHPLYPGRTPRTSKKTWHKDITLLSMNFWGKERQVNLGHYGYRDDRFMGGVAELADKDAIYCYRWNIAKFTLIWLKFCFQEEEELLSVENIRTLPMTTHVSLLKHSSTQVEACKE